MKYKQTNPSKIQENTIKEVKEINKTVQNLKMEIEVVKKTWTKGILEMENQGKKTETTDTSITKGIEDLGEKILRHRRFYWRKRFISHWKW